MSEISLNEEAWSQTFPHLVPIRGNEWIVGVLLRCDESNHWQSGTALSYLLGPLTRRKLMQGIDLLAEIHLQKLARALAVPLTRVAATIYSSEELQRLYTEASLHTERTHSSRFFHLCPLCIAESRFLSRTLALPGITHCPQHRISLVSTCLCGSALSPFNPNTAPFTCSICGLNWANSPNLPADPVQIETEQKLLHLILKSEDEQ